MLKEFTKIVSGFLAVVLAVVFFLSFFIDFGLKADASTTVGNDYKSIVATSSLASATTSLSFTGGSLGSVIIVATSTAAGVQGPVVAFYDTASTTQATSTMRQIAVIGAAGAQTPPHGTYTFDIATTKGLQMWVNPTFTGTYVVTYR